MTDADEAAIALLATDDWQVSLHQDGTLQAEYGIAELTGLNTRTGWPQGLRLLVRRNRPSRRHLKMLTPFERKTGWRYQIIATNIGRMWGIAGSHQPQWLDVLHRAHAGVDRAPTRTGLTARTPPRQHERTPTFRPVEPDAAAATCEGPPPLPEGRRASTGPAISHSHTLTNRG
jgi:hypothetical protein